MSQSINSTSELVDNSVNFDPTMESIPSPEQSHGVKKLTPGNAMILKVTHPPTVCEEFAGLPTMDTRTQVIINWRNIDILKEPIAIDQESHITATVPWQQTSDYSFIVPTGARVKWIGCCYGIKAGVSNTLYDQDLANVGIQDNFDFKVWSKTANNYRPVAKSTTIYPNVTAFNNQGILSAQQFNPTLLFAGTLSDLSYNNVKLFHHYLDELYKSSKRSFVRDVSQVHPELNLYAFESWMRSRALKPTGLELDPNVFIQIVNLGTIGYLTDIASLVPTPSQILTNSMRSYADKFINGAFTVQRINTLSPAWMAGSNTFINSVYPGLYQCYTFTQSVDGSGHLISLKEPSVIGVASDQLAPLLDTLWTQDMTWSFIRMQGITPNPNITGQIAPSVASPISIKTYYTFESQPVWNGPWNGLSRTSPMPCLKDMENLMDTFYNMKDSMPAKMNFLGSFLPTLISMLPAGLKVLKSVLTPKGEEDTTSPGASNAPLKLENELTSLLTTVAGRVGAKVANKISGSKHATHESMQKAKSSVKK